jgi:hypothetical protein
MPANDEAWIRITVWLALVAWAAGEMLGRRPRIQNVSRVVWSIGALALLVHLALAMHWKHGWSHAAAVADTARQTNERFSLNWGGGVWLNYLMIAWWLLDAAWLWRSPANWAASSPWRTARRGFFLFMWFNGAVVFPTGAVRWLALGLCVAVTMAWWKEAQSSKLKAQNRDQA